MNPLRRLAEDNLDCEHLNQMFLIWIIAGAA